MNRRDLLKLMPAGLLALVPARLLSKVPVPDAPVDLEESYVSEDDIREYVEESEGRAREFKLDEGSPEFVRYKGVAVNGYTMRQDWNGNWITELDYYVPTASPLYGVSFFVACERAKQGYSEDIATLVPMARDLVERHPDKADEIWEKLDEVFRAHAKPLIYSAPQIEQQPSDVFPFPSEFDGTGGPVPTDGDFVSTEPNWIGGHDTGPTDGGWSSGITMTDENVLKADPESSGFMSTGTEMVVGGESLIKGVTVVGGFDQCVTASGEIYLDDMDVNAQVFLSERSVLALATAYCAATGKKGFLKYKKFGDDTGPLCTLGRLSIKGGEVRSLTDRSNEPIPVESFSLSVEAGELVSMEAHLADLDKPGFWPLERVTDAMLKWGLEFREL